MKAGDLVGLAEITGFKGILLSKETEPTGKAWEINPQLPFNFINNRKWKVFWFNHPLGEEPIIEVYSEMSLRRLADAQK